MVAKVGQTGPGTLSSVLCRPWLWCKWRARACVYAMHFLVMHLLLLLSHWHCQLPLVDQPTNPPTTRQVSGKGAWHGLSNLKCKCKSRKVAKWSFPWHKHIYFGRWTGNQTRNGSTSILQLQFTVDISTHTHTHTHSLDHRYLLTYVCANAHANIHISALAATCATFLMHLHAQRDRGKYTHTDAER